jgi:hypothetical protein
MKTHNAIVYHCISCGRIEHTELEAEPPLCCGHAMAKACAQTVREGDLDQEQAGGPSETTTPVIEQRKKPR